MPQFEQGEEGNFVSVKRAASAWEKFRFGTGWRSKMLLAGKMKVIRDAGKSFSSQFEICWAQVASHPLFFELMQIKGTGEGVRGQSLDFLSFAYVTSPDYLVSKMGSFVSQLATVFEI